MTVDLSFQPRYECATCQTRCDGRSKTAYVFADDVQLSEASERWMIERLRRLLACHVEKTPAEAHGLPDLAIKREHNLIARVEVKVQTRAFMKVASFLPSGNLLPYETVALNLSDLERYFRLHESENIPIFVVWHVKRPCIGDEYWGNTLAELALLYKKYGNRRRFQRASTQSDYVAGIHKGVTVNYHFSLRELKPLKEVEAMITQLVFGQ